MSAATGETMGSIELRTVLARSRVSRAEALALHLETEIAAHALPAGERLGTKDELRRRFGVAVATVNEAVRMMEMRGLVTARPGPGGGLFVASVADRARTTHTILGLDWEQATLQDCIELRNALEPSLIRRAAAERSTKDVAELRALLAEMEAGIEDPKAYFKANWRLHRRIADICRGAPLRSVYLVVIDFLEAGLEDFEFEAPAMRNVETHSALVEAIADPSPARIDEAVRRHLANSPLP